MSDNEELEHEFDMSWLNPLDAEQVHYLFFYIFSANKHFAPKPGIGQPAGIDPDTIHSWKDLTFYINTKCPDSTSYPTEIYRTVWNNYQRLHTRHPQWRLKYSRLTQVFPDPWLAFMNYGYYDFETGNSGLELEHADEEWRYAIQLYHRLLGSVQLKGKDVVEIGCGRGGGASFITRYMKPASYTGTDGTMSNIMFCKQAHDVSSLDFQWSRAENLPFPDESFDIALNLESCNYYEPFTDFVDGVHRVLKPGGHFLLSTWDNPVRMMEFRSKCEMGGFEIVEEEDMTFNVAVALEAFDGGRHIFANHETVRRNHLYLESWRRLYDVAPIQSGQARYCRFTFRKR